MIVGVPGSGKHEVVARFLLLARKLKKKVLVMGISNQSIDNILHRLIALQDRFKDQFTDEERSRFVRVSSNSAQIHPKLHPFVSNCTSFESL